MIKKKNKKFFEKNSNKIINKIIFSFIYKLYQYNLNKIYKLN